MKTKRYWLRGGIIGFALVAISLLGKDTATMYEASPDYALQQIVMNLLGGFFWGAIIAMIYQKVYRKNAPVAIPSQESVSIVNGAAAPVAPVVAQQVPMST